MMDNGTFLLTPAAAAYLGQFVLSLIYIAAFQHPQRQGRSDTGAARTLQWGFVFLALFALAGFFENGFQRGGRVMGAYLRPTTGMLCGWALLRYTFLFLNPDARFRRLYHTLLILATGCLAWEFWTLSERLYRLLADGRVVWKSDPESINSLVVQLFPLILACLRWRNLASDEARVRGWGAAFWRPADRQLRAVRFLALLLLTFAGFALIESVEVLGVPQWIRQFTTGFGVLISCYFLGYLSMSELDLRFSLGAKIRGIIALVTLMVLILIALAGFYGIVVQRQYLAAPMSSPASKLSDHQSLWWTPTPKGYRVASRPPEWFPGGTPQSAVDSVVVALPFAFPLGGATHREIVADKNGLIGFGTNEFHYSDFLWRCNVRPLLAPGYIDLNPDTSRDGHLLVSTNAERVTITWSRLAAWEHPSFRPEFQAVLHRNGSVQYNYRDLVDPDHDLADSRPLLEFIGVFQGPGSDPSRFRLLGGQVVGNVEGAGPFLDFTSDWCEQFLSFSEGMSLLIVVTPLLLAFAAERVLRRRILGPLDRLVAAVGSMNEGRPVPALPVASNDEIGYLTDGFNRMSASVGAATEALRQQRDRLEEEVRIRTRDLEAELVERREAERRADAANRAKSDFLSNMSHELRTPLSGVIGMTTLLLDTRLDDAQREYAATAHEAAGALLNVVGDILDFSKIEAGRLQLSPISFRPAELLKEVASILSAAAEARRLEIAIAVHPGVPDRVVADMGRVRQVVLNLVGNAVKFTEHGYVRTTIAAEPLPGGRTRLVWRIEDTGMGMRPEVVARLFTPFEQEDASTARKFGGTGLGLAICRRLATLMDGTVDCESREGVGSTFTFTMLASVESGPAAAKDLSALGLRIALISPTPVIRDCLMEQLHGAGVSGILVFESLAAALAAVGADTPSLDWILVDRPVRDPFPLAELKALRRVAPFAASRLLLLTPKSTALPADQRQEFGIHGRLFKPWLSTDLVRCLDQDPVEAKGTPRAASGEEPVPGDGEPERALPKVLVVDDNKINRRLALLHLQRLNVEAHSAAGGMEALEILEGARMDVLMMDCQMPGLDGYETARRIRANPGKYGDPYIIAFTADASEESDGLRRQSGMEDTLSKPFRAAGMKEAIDRGLEALSKRRGNGRAG